MVKETRKISRYSTKYYEVGVLLILTVRPLLKALFTKDVTNGKREKK